MGNNKNNRIYTYIYKNGFPLTYIYYYIYMIMTEKNCIYVYIYSKDFCQRKTVYPLMFFFFSFLLFWIRIYKYNYEMART